MAEKSSSAGSSGEISTREKSISNVINLKYVQWFASPEMGNKDGDKLKIMVKDKFGPPLFDEKSRTRKWRLFKKSFLWGK